MSTSLSFFLSFSLSLSLSLSHSLSIYLSFYLSLSLLLSLRLSVHIYVYDSITLSLPLPFFLLSIYLSPHTPPPYLTLDAAKKNKELLIELAALRNEDVHDTVKAMKKESSGTNIPQLIRTNPEVQSNSIEVRTRYSYNCFSCFQFMKAI